MIEKIALGTVQFGLDYGVANTAGRVTPQEVKKILDYARQNNIKTLDTAIAYGESEQVLGSVGINDFEVVTKLPSVPEDADISKWMLEQIRESKLKLGVDTLKAVLLHRPLELFDIRGKEIYESLLAMKQNENVEKIGVSVYQPSDITSVIKEFDIDLVQLPYNLLDGRWKRVFTELKNRKIEVHARSVFLQGLLLMEEKPTYFEEWSGVWNGLDNWLHENQITALEASLNFVLQQSQVDKLVIGVDSLIQLQQITDAIKSIPENIPSELKIDDERLLNPGLWRLDD